MSNEKQTTGVPLGDVTLIPDEPDEPVLNIKKRSLLKDLDMLLHPLEEEDEDYYVNEEEFTEMTSQEDGPSKSRSKRIRRTLVEQAWTQDDPICLNASLVCDGVPDCPAENGTISADELECERTCPPGMVPCSDGIIARSEKSV